MWEPTLPGELREHEFYSVKEERTGQSATDVRRKTGASPERVIDRALPGLHTRGRTRVKVVGPGSTVATSGDRTATKPKVSYHCFAVNCFGLP